MALAATRAIKKNTHGLLVYPRGLTHSVNEPAMQDLKMNWRSSECGEPEIVSPRKDIKEPILQFVRACFRL
jgi:hypothetical protein